MNKFENDSMTTEKKYFNLINSLLDIIVELDLDGAQEPTIAPADKEYKLRIISCEGLKQDKNGNDYIMPKFEIPSEPTSKEFTKYLKLATPNNLKDLSKKEANTLKWSNANFLLCFRIDAKKKFKPENDLVGKTGWAILGVESDEEYGDKNYIKRLIVPK